MKKFVLIAAMAAAAAVSSPALGAEVSEEALAECQARHSEFAKVKKCLAPTHIALELLSAVQAEDLYGSAGADLVRICREQEEPSVSVWSCARHQLREADQLLDMVGDPSKVSDPAFAPLARPEAYAAVRKREEDMRQQFSRELAGGTYFP
ncbi:hypothetical protein [Leisingera daeponensis]|uniref:hypothetical protein n=1 Tax=Leisingera daeponensis TaxID=405746 RepID=UPI001C980F57|nr:hypothetical protein [Leisingera daeponensis]MBY6055353.1 hypothetical protein [Leisingera daeponensis]